MSTTILDRLMHHCHLLEFDGRNYRLKEAAETLARKSKKQLNKGISSGEQGGGFLRDHKQGIFNCRPGSATGTAVKGYDATRML